MSVLVRSSVAILIFATGRPVAADTFRSPAAPAALPWAGSYIGTNFALGWGRSDWSIAPTNGPSSPSSVIFPATFDAFRGTGSYALGLQAGYNHQYTSGLVLGLEADVSFPNTIGGNRTSGNAIYEEKLLFGGTIRGRLGYELPNHWLSYVTGGLAWSYSQFTRTPDVTSLSADSVSMIPRLGVAVGGGIEVPLTSSWSARLEYMFTSFGNRTVNFPAFAERSDADLHLQSLRVGLNYKMQGPSATLDFAKELQPLETDRFAFRGQATFLSQYAAPFRAPYSGQNSLSPNQGRETWDVTLYAGVRLWQGAEVWFNPEIDQGFGLSGTLGVAGFPSGEAYKVGASVPYARLQRYFFRQTIDLGGEVQKVDPGPNQFTGQQTADRLVITAGKFSVVDIFDVNKYAHDPRVDFMNWSVIDTATFDYAADAWGYTYGAAVEWYKGNWTLRGGLFDLSVVPNSTQLDPQFQQFQWVGEIEHRHNIWGQPGKVLLTGFLTRGRMGRFDDAVNLAQLTGGPADITAVRRYRSRTGMSLSLEQQIAPGVGMFARGGLANGQIEPYEFTDVDRTLAAGLSVSGKPWGRPDDTMGFAAVANGISAKHQEFFNAGGLGILIGDGQLPNPGWEKIVEVYYSLPLNSWRLTFDYQFIANPAYNRDRGPVSVAGARLRASF